MLILLLLVIVRVDAFENVINKAIDVDIIDA